MTEVDFCYSSANLRKSVTGSDPEDKIISNGVIWFESLKHLPNSNDGAKIYC